VDRDPAALSISCANVNHLKISEKYTFVEADMFEFLQTIESSLGKLICSNPPYVPVPKGVDPAKFLPVNGGADGSIVLRKILTQEFETGTYLCILWSSLSNPKKIIGIIERSYKGLIYSMLVLSIRSLH